MEQLWWLTKNDFPDLPLKQKLRFLQRARKSMGKTALCLSGGGAHGTYTCTHVQHTCVALNRVHADTMYVAMHEYMMTTCITHIHVSAMYHVGIVKALFDGGCLPTVINGSSGGSIIAGVLATRTDAELRDPTFLDRRLSNR